jgi:histidinol phosphatase-like PHP family hydrolase
MTFDHDLHIHTHLSACCPDKEQRPAQILAQALRLGRGLIGFSDHIWTNPAAHPSDFYRSQDARQIVRLREELSGVSTPVRVLIGCEADTVAPGIFSITREFADTLDYVLLSCSHFHMRKLVQQPQAVSPRILGEHMLTFFRSAATSGLATAIAHPLLPYGFASLFEPAVDALSDAELQDAFALAAGRRVALEITAAYIPPPATGAGSVAWSPDVPRRIISLARAASCLFTWGSDAHTLEGLARLEGLAPLVAPLGLCPSDFAAVTRARTGTA